MEAQQHVSDEGVVNGADQIIQELRLHPQFEEEHVQEYMLDSRLGALWLFGVMVNELILGSGLKTTGEREDHTNTLAFFLNTILTAEERGKILQGLKDRSPFL